MGSSVPKGVRNDGDECDEVYGGWGERCVDRFLGESGMRWSRRH